MTNPPYSTGALPLPRDHAAAHPALAVPAALTTYPSVDYRDHAPPIRNQGGRGTCVGFGVSKANETWTGILFGNVVPYVSPLDLYNLALTYDGLADWRKSNNNPDGTWVWAACKALITDGVATEADCPYVETQVGTGRLSVRRTNEYKLRTYMVGYGVDALKAAVQTGPVAVVVNCDAPLFFPKDGVIDYDGSESFNSAHCLPVLAYDADRGRFLVANSWGEGWGLGGYAWFTGEWFSYRGADVTTLVPDIDLKILGDLNGDTYITAGDVTLALADIVGKRAMTDTVRRVLDINRDSHTDIRDALQILRSWIA